jgi:hypothetical protein
MFDVAMRESRQLRCNAAISGDCGVRQIEALECDPEFRSVDFFHIADDASRQLLKAARPV